MLSLDLASDGILFQCDGCRHVGEIHVEGMAEDGSVYCWKCLGRMKAQETQKKARVIRIMEPKGAISPVEDGQCGRCGVIHEPVSIFVDENGQGFCVTCWLGKEPTGSRRRLILIET
ncbi:MAG TPA: hypothetical protein VHE12_04180 [bacterium]|nr:hypothetical protein [bacterium]